MPTTFDCLRAPWVPVVEMDGTRRELGLMEALARAHELQAVRDVSPLVEYSVYRFLIVFLMDALRPEDDEALEDLLERGRFDAAALERYVERCRGEGVSFDLFDPERPFLQTTCRKEWDREPKSVSTLDYAVPNGNNHVHFDHRSERVVYSPGKALRMMLTAQIFCTAAAQGYPSNVNGAPPWFALIQGDNLFQTLVFGMLTLDRVKLPIDDPPVLWRDRAEVVSKKEVARVSWLQGMFFPARRIRLIPDEGGESVSRVYFSQGMNCLVAESWTDPHVAYRVSDKGRSNWKPTDDQTIWRNLTLLLDTRKQAPQIVGQYAGLDLPERWFTLTLYGVQTNKASYLRSQRHDLQLPSGLLGNASALRYIADYIDRAQRLGDALARSLQQKEIPPESRTQARQNFYARCERFLWGQFDELTRATPDYEGCARAAREAQIQAARDCADQVLEQLALRGQTLVQVMGGQKRFLEKEIAAIQKKEAKA